MQNADRLLEVITCFESTRGYCKDYLYDGIAGIPIEIILGGFVLERQMVMKEADLEGLPAREYSDEELEITAVLRKVTQVLFDYDILLFTESTIVVDG